MGIVGMLGELLGCGNKWPGDLLGWLVSPVAWGCCGAKLGCIIRRTSPLTEYPVLGSCNTIQEHLSVWLSLSLSLSLSHTRISLTHTIWGICVWLCKCEQLKTSLSQVLPFSFMLPTELHSRFSVQSNTSCFHWLDLPYWLFIGSWMKSAAIVFRCKNNNNNNNKKTN